MTILAEIVFWSSAFLLFHSYVLYPLLVKIAAWNKRNNNIIYPEDDLPGVTVITAAYNEEEVIGEKLHSIIQSVYPAGKIEVLIGSDASDDGTDRIVSGFNERNPDIILKRYEYRTGKSPILNDLKKRARNEIIIFTDANVIFDEHMIFHLGKHFRNERISLVGATVVNKGKKSSGISFQESAYIVRENRIKYLEGIVWGSVAGAFGACYAIRKKDIPEIPPGFLMEDFYITLDVISHGNKAICEPDAKCYEDVSDDIREEFKRKMRISAGNFQNLSVYYPLLFRVFSGAAFSFFSHKVIRWFGPFLILASLVCALFVSVWNPFYRVIFFIQVMVMLLPFCDYLSGKLGIYIKPLRFITHFWMMNLALLTGFFRYLGGIKTNVWIPTKRNV
ncbi:MAG: glycosyltransferase [Bacteroidetes bacterium]|nr:glycosyltransferase [Bacteroidota bacterium]